MPNSQEMESRMPPARLLQTVTQIRDVYLVEMHASAPEDTNQETVYINLQIGERKFRTTPGMLQVGLTAHVLYFSEKPEIPSDGEVLSRDDAIGSITLDYVIELEVNEDVVDSEINDASIGRFVDSTLTFVLFPYIRAEAQRISASMPFPHTVIPFMRRNV